MSNHSVLEGVSEMEYESFDLLVKGISSNDTEYVSEFLTRMAAGKWPLPLIAAKEADKANDDILALVLDHAFAFGVIGDEKCFLFESSKEAIIFAVEEQKKYKTWLHWAHANELPRCLEFLEELAIPEDLEKAREDGIVKITDESTTVVAIVPKQ